MPKQRLAPGFLAPVYLNEALGQRLAGTAFVNETATTLLARDAASVADWAARSATDNRATVALGMGLAGDAAARSEAAAGQAALATAALLASATQLGQSPAASEASLAGAGELAALVETAAAARAAVGLTNDAPAVLLGGGASPSELAAGQVVNHTQWLDWTGALVITAEVAAPLAFAAKLAADPGAPITGNAGLMAGVTLPEDIGAAAAADSAMAVDLGHRSASDVVAALDHVASLAGDTRQAIAWSAAIVGASDAPATFGADLAALTGALFEWFARRPIRRVLLIFRAPR